MSKVLTVVVTLVAVLVVAGFVAAWLLLKLEWGTCPSVTVQQNFQIEKYTGQWYQQAGYNLGSVQGNRRCVFANYTLAPTKDYIIVQNRGIDPSSNTWGGIDGTVRPDDPSKNEGKLTVTFQPLWWLTVNGPYWVLGTDYTSYVTVFNCNNWLFIFHYYSSWYLSREQNFQTPEDEAKYFSITDNLLTSNHLDPNRMERTRQANCVV